MTGRGLKTVQFITQEVCKVIVSNLWIDYVNFPETVDQMLTAISQMEDKWQFPSAFGGMDGCHISMKCPRGENHARKENYNFNIFYSIIFMSIIEADYKFFWTSVRLPGSSSDACFRLHQNVLDNKFLPEIQKVVNSPNGNVILLPPILFRDSVFPHHAWLQKLSLGNSRTSITA